MANFDMYPRIGTTDAGVATAPSGSVPSTGLVPGAMFNVRVPFAAGTGTARDISFVLPYKARLVDACASVTTAVGSSTIQVWTAALGTGTAASSAMATSSTGKARDALTTASQVFAAAATVYCYQSAGATYAGGELNLSFQLEQ